MASTIPTPPSAWPADFDGDGRFTVGDAGLWLQQAFFLPGDWAIWALATYASPAAEFLELGSGAYGGVLSGFVSALAWLTLLVILGTTYGMLRDADRAFTERIRALYLEGRRRIRAARTLFAARRGERDRQREKR